MVKIIKLVIGLNLFIIVLITLSCNYKIVVPKSDVIYNECGFVLMKDNAMFFVESKDSMMSFAKILNKIDRKTFTLNNLSDQKIYAFKGVSTSIAIKTVDPFDNVTLHTDSIYYVFMRIMGYPIKSTFSEIAMSEKYTSFLYNNETYKLYFDFFRYDLYFFYPEDIPLKDKFIKKMYEYNSKFY
jgi:hypothetical protein